MVRLSLSPPRVFQSLRQFSIIIMASLLVMLTHTKLISLLGQFRARHLPRHLEKLVKSQNTLTLIDFHMIIIHFHVQKSLTFSTGK